MLITSLLLVSICSCLIGNGFYTRKSDLMTQALAPVLGLATIVVLSSSCFLLRVSPSVPFLTIVLLSLISVIRISQDQGSTRCIQQLLSIMLTVTFLCIPFWLRFGNADVTPGYLISNDSVMHALLSRGENSNQAIADKLYPAGGGHSEYPLGAHSIINLIYSSLHTDPRALVFAFGLLALAFSVFPVKVLLMDQRGVSGFTLRDNFLAALGVASYYNVAMVYHGFLPQVTFVSFALTSVIFMTLVSKEDSLNFRWHTFCSALAAAAALSCYSFAAAIILAAAVILAPLGSGWDKHIRFVATFSVLTVAMLGANLILIWHTIAGIVGHVLGIGGTSELLSQTSSYGNLVGFLNPLMWTGLWWESDYRFLSIQNPKSQLVLFLSVIGVCLASLGISRQSFGPSISRRMLGSGAIAYIAILALTKSPYTTSKIASFVAPVVATMMLRGVIALPISSIKRFAIVAVLATILTGSNIHLLNNIAALPGAAIESMLRIARDYNGKRLLVFSGNDWLLYTLDSKIVDIVGLHYLPDRITSRIQPSDYAAVVLEQGDNRKSEYPCVHEHDYSPFVVCDL